MKTILCSYEHCSERRVHWERPEEMRPHQSVEVPDDFPDDGLAFCSITCACLSGHYNINNGWKNKEKEK